MLDLHVCLVALLALVHHPAVVAAVEGRGVGLVLVAVPVVAGGEQLAAQLARRRPVAVQNVVQSDVLLQVVAVTGVYHLQGKERVKRGRLREWAEWQGKGNRYGR